MHAESAPKTILTNSSSLVTSYYTNAELIFLTN